MKVLGLTVTILGLVLWMGTRKRNQPVSGAQDEEVLPAQVEISSGTFEPAQGQTGPKSSARPKASNAPLPGPAPGNKFAPKGDPPMELSPHAARARESEQRMIRFLKEEMQLSDSEIQSIEQQNSAFALEYDRATREPNPEPLLEEIQEKRNRSMRQILGPDGFSRYQNFVNEENKRVAEIFEKGL